MKETSASMKYDGMPLLAHAIVQQQRARANAGTSLGLTISECAVKPRHTGGAATVRGVGDASNSLR